jgi:hypothetical protein
MPLQAECPVKDVMTSLFHGKDCVQFSTGFIQKKIVSLPWHPADFSNEKPIFDSMRYQELCV